MTHIEIHRTPLRVVFAVLAAGRSTRFGAAKQLALWDGKPLVRHVLDQVEGVPGCDCLLVVGHERRAVLDAAMPLSGFVVVNDAYDKGIGSSIAAAVRAARHAADAVVVVLADQPLVTTAQLAALVDSWPAEPDVIVASAYADTMGPPVLLPSGTFVDLLSLDDDRGARSVLRDERYRVQSIRCDAAAFDIDSPADLEQRSQFTQPEPPST